MTAKVLLRHPQHDVPARRETEFIEDQDWQGGGYFSFESDSPHHDKIGLSLDEIKRHPNHYELYEPE